MDRIWRDAPLAALRVWPEGSGLRVEPNRAAGDLARHHGMDGGDWSTLAARAVYGATPAPFEADLQPPAPRLRVTRVDLDAGWLLWLEPLRELADDALADRLDLLEEVGRMGLAVRDLKSGRGHWDSQVFRLFGRDENRATPSLEQVLAQVHPDDLAATREHLRSLAERPRRDEARFRILRPDGEVRHVHSIHEVRRDRDGRPSLLLDVLIDDTEVVERIAAERRVAEVLDRALVLAELSLWRVDLATRQIRFNAVGCRQNHLPPGVDTVPIDQVRATVHPDDLPGLLRAADEAIASDRVVDLVARYDDFEGGWRTLLTRRVADRDEQGRAVALTGVSIDLTAQMVEREQARLLAEDKRRAEQARRDQSVFLARISQELRAPMRSLVGYAGLMAGDGLDPLSPRQRQRLERIREAAQRLESITEGLLEVAARDAAVREAPADAAADAATTPSKLLRLVCVEDNPVNMLLVRELLALRPEVELHCAENGLAGVELATRVRPQAMLLDLQLPDIGGHEVMHRVRRELGDGECTYIALSANAMPDHIRDMLALGFDQYWTKPIDFSAFLAGIDGMIDARRPRG